jgi:hypothetical protein
MEATEMHGSSRRTDWIDDRIPKDIRNERLRTTVQELLAAARRGECRPEMIELAALHTTCAKYGLFDAARDIRRYIAFATHVAHSSPAVH